MSARRSYRLLWIIATLALTVAASVILRATVLAVFGEIEREQAVTAMARAETAFRQELTRLHTLSDDASLRRDRAGAGHLTPASRDDGRRDRRRERARARLDLLVHGQVGQVIILRLCAIGDRGQG